MLLPSNVRELWQRTRARTARENLAALAEYLELRPHLQGAPYLLAAVVVGFVAVLYSSLFSGSIAAARAMAAEYPFVYPLAGATFFVLSVLVVRRFAPEAGGLGVPQVARALDQVDDGSMAAHINMRVAGVTMASSLLALLGGGGLGREGPMVLIAACIFYSTSHYFRRLWPESDHRSWLVAGGAAGIAAAFQTPLAGVIFVLEELAHVHYREFKTFVISAVVVAGMIAQWLYGRYLFLGYAKVGAVPVSTVLWSAAAGLACGLIAAYFERTRDWLDTRFAGMREAAPLRFAAALGVLIGLIAVFEPRAVGGGISLIEGLLFTDGARAEWWVPVARFVSPLLAHTTGAAGGFLAPALSLGASIGSLFAQVLASDHHNLLVMSGMVAFLAATTRAPFTALVVVMEMTDSHAAIFPLMIAAVGGVGMVSLVRRRQLARRRA